MNHTSSTARRRLHRRQRQLGHALRLVILGAPIAASAQATVDAPTTLPSVEVTGSSTSQPLTRVTEDIAASPASVTVLGRKDLDSKTITTYGDIFRGLPGVFVNEYGQGLVAYELKFRGFASGHGRDAAGFLDGVPLNITGSQHTNGYMDLAQLIPELVDRVEIVRGPFSVYAGNHAVAGSVQFYTDRSVPSMLKATVDSFGRARVLPVYSRGVGPGDLLLAVDATKGSAYTNQSDVERLNIFTRYSVPMLGGIGALRFQSYNAIAEAPGYLDLARIESGEISRRDALAKGLGDAKHQQNAVFNFRSDDGEGRSGLRGGWTGSVYAVRDRRERYTFYDLAAQPDSDVPIGAERDRLHQSGLDLRKTTSFALAGMPAQVTAGLQYNREHVAAVNFVADSDRHQVAPSVGTPDVIGVDRDVRTTTRAFYAQLQLQPVPILKLTGGLRYDHIGFDVALHPDDDTYATASAAGLATIDTSSSRLSPKLGAALQVLDTGRSTIDLYTNYALGLKSPYAFSDFYANVDTSSATPDLALSTLRSVEFGATGNAKDGSMRWRVGVWDTRQEKEGQRNDAGIFQAFGTTTRRGFDAEGSLLVTPADRVYANYSAVRARSLTAPSGESYIPNVPEWIASLGVQSRFAAGPHRLDVSLEDSLVGPQPLTADNVLRSRRYNRLTARAAYSSAAYKGASAFVQLVAYDRPLTETQFDFGDGQIGVSPRPRLAAVIGVQLPFNF